MDVNPDTTSRTTASKLVALACLAALAALLVVTAGCATAGQDVSRAQLQVCGDLVEGVLNGDAMLVEGAIPPEVAEVHAEDLAGLRGLGAQPSDIQREWVDDELHLTIPASAEVYRLWVDEEAETATVRGRLANEDTSFELVETADGWRVSVMDGLTVGALLEALAMAPASDAELEAWNQRLDCFMYQTIFEAAVEVFGEVNGAPPTSIDDLVPDWLETVDHCPTDASQYSAASSDDGYFSGLGPDGVLSPCSVHGHHSDQEDY